MQGPVFDPWAGRIPWRRAWEPTPVFLLGESHGQTTLVGYSPWGYRDQTQLRDYTTTTKALITRMWAIACVYLSQVYKYHFL